MTKYLLGICLLWMLPMLSAQHKTIRKLANIPSEKMAEFTWHAAESQSQDYPKDWNEGSAIYLNYTNIYDVEKDGSARVGLTQLIHRKVKMLDESALENFSEIRFPGQSREIGFKRVRTSSGVRIIKKSGKVENIQADDYILNTDDNTKKLAVPNLEIGDILEYFIFANDSYAVNYLYGDPLIYAYFPLQREYPILHYKYAIQSEEGYPTWMHTNDETMKVMTDKSVNNVLTQYIEVDNINSVESEMWYNPYKDLPTLKTQVMGVRSRAKNSGKRLSAGEVMDYTRSLFYVSSFDRLIEKAYKKSLKKRKADKLTGSKALKDYYFFLRHLMEHREIMSDEFVEADRNYSANYFYYAMIRKMEELDINYKYVAIREREDGSIDDVINTSELNYLLRAEIDLGVYFSYLSPFMAYGYIPYRLENSEAYVVYNAEDYRTHGRSNKGRKILMPKSDYWENGMVHKSVIDFDSQDLTLMNVKTDVKLTGHQYPAYIYPLVDWYDEIWSEIDRFETPELAKSSDAKADLRKQRRKVMETRKEYMTEQHEAYAKNHYSNEVKEITNGKSTLYERDGKPTELDIHFDCEMDNVVKKVGPNYIVKLGKLVGGQVSIDDEPRQHDVHMNYPRIFDYTVKINLPEGYSVDGLDDLDKDIENEAGLFFLSHQLDGNTLTVHFKKAYKNYYQKKEDWNLMAAFLKPANLFESKEILLRKK